MRCGQAVPLDRIAAHHPRQTQHTNRRTTMKGTTARRTVATVDAFASAALIMSGCAGAGPEASAAPQLELSDEPVTINITWWGSDSRAELTNEAIAAFEAKYPNITVEGEYKDF